MASIVSGKALSISELVILEARQLVDMAEYADRFEDCRPPEIVSCSMLVWWVYTESGVKMPAVSSQLLHDLLYWGHFVSPDRMERATLLFTAGRRRECEDKYRASLGVGHVGIVTGDGSVIHASCARNRVIEEPVEEFISGINYFRACYSVL